MAHRHCLKFAAALAALLVIPASQALAGIAYTTMSSLYSENFNGLPTDMPASNSSIEGVYADGWQDDVDYTLSSQDDVSVLGWHLFHPINPGAENGFNGNQRLRNGVGQNTGAFWSYGASASDTEKALGSLGSTTIAANGANMYMGLQLINNTGVALNRFTLTFDGEQWRDGQSASGETLAFEFSTIANDTDWNTLAAPLFTAAPALNFTAPVVVGTGTSGTAVDGNTAGRVADITATVTNFTWAPGAELWLRWADPQLAGNADDGLAIDNVRFTADNLGVGASNDIVSVQTGNSSAPSTWSNGQSPASGNTYRVLTTHTVTVDSQFDGDLLRAEAGGIVNIGPGANATPIAFLDIDSGGSLTESVSGDFQLGVGTADVLVPLGDLTTDQDITLTADAGSDIRIDLQVSGDADLTLNTNGDGSDVILFDVADLVGTIKFNGTGDKLRMVREQRLDVLEMNSTGGAGANVLSYETRENTGGGILIFNQSGTIDHATTSASSTRLVQPQVIEANAPVTVDLSRPIVTDGVSVFQERRFQLQDGIRGAQDITVNGSASPNSAAELAAGITLNEFELGSTGDTSGGIPANTFAGVLTANNYVNVELRNSLPAAKIVVNDNARFEMGRQVVGTAKVTNFGEIDVNAGGTLEVGFEQVQDSNSPQAADTGQHVGHLGLVNTDGRPGTLTLQHGQLSNPSDVNSEPLGSLLVMQVNGKNANEYDTIAAQGAIALDGVLKIVVNPKSSLSSGTAGTQNPVYTPVLGDVITLITSSAGSLPGNFNGDSVVNAADLAIWKTAYETSAAGDADGDSDTDGNDFLIWQRNLGQSASGAITGTFDDIVFEDVALNPSLPPVASDAPDTTPAVLVNSEGVMASLDLKFVVQITSSAVNLLVVDATPVGAVPEPAAALLASFGLIALAAGRRTKR